jgi:hypothetical protein
MWAGWFDEYADTIGMAESIRPVVSKKGMELLESVTKTEQGESE